MAKTTKALRAIDHIRNNQRFARSLQNRIPWLVKRAGIYLVVSGYQISFTEDGDYLSLDEAREVLSFLVEEIGGAVAWEVKE